MLGKVVWQDEDKLHELVVEDDGSIRSTDENVADMARFQRQIMDPSPAQGYWVARLLNRVAQAVGGQAEIAEKQETDKNAIY